jgi:MoaA/NifB/PqqE/SkfB family radical SAM enzyme
MIAESASKLGRYAYFVRHNLESRLLGRRRPLLAGFKLTDRCNLSCRACPFWQRAGEDMPLRGVLETLHRLHAAGVRLCILEGGEPFLWHDGPHGLEDVIAASRELFFCTGVVTNGLQPIQTQADVVWVSLDGLRESHDYNRGRTFDRVIEHVQASRHPRLLANVTINRRNWQEIPALVEFLADKVRAVTIQFYYPYPGTEDLFLPFPERRQVLDRLIQLKRAGLPIADSIAALRALRDNSWRCFSWLISSAEPDGRITFGCYLKNRAAVHCEQCGFAAHTEISMAYNGSLGAIRAGRAIFGF